MYKELFLYCICFQRSLTVKHKCIQITINILCNSKTKTSKHKLKFKSV